MPATQNNEHCARNNTLTKLVLVFTEALLAAAQFLGTILCGKVTWLKGEIAHLLNVITGVST